MNEVTPSLEEFRTLAATRRVIPVYRRLLADAETAIGLYRKAGGKPSGQLPPGVGRAGRLVPLFLHRRTRGGDGDRARRRGGVDRPSARRTAQRRRPAGDRSGDAAAAAHATHRRSAAVHLRPGGIPELRHRAPARTAAGRQRRRPAIPELSFLLASDLAVLDQHTNEVWLIANAINFDDTDERVDEAYADAVARVEEMTALLAEPTPSAVVSAQFDQIPADPPPAHPGAVPVGGRGGGRGDQGRRGVPDRGQPAVRGGHHRRRAGHLPGAAAAQPEPVHVPAPADRQRRRTLRHRRIQPGGAGHGQGGHRDHPPDRRIQAAGGDPGRGRRPGDRVAGRPQGAGRARDAGRPGPQRSGPGLPTGHGRGGGVHGGPPLQPHHAPGVDGHRNDRRRTAPPWTWCWRRFLRGRCPARPRSGRWRSSTSWRCPAAACTAGWSAIWTSPAMRTRRSPSARPCCGTGWPTSRPGEASSPTPTRPPRTRSRRTRRPRWSARSPWRRAFRRLRP